MTFELQFCTTVCEHFSVSFVRVFSHFDTFRVGGRMHWGVCVAVLCRVSAISFIQSWLSILMSNYVDTLLCGAAPTAWGKRRPFPGYFRVSEPCALFCFHLNILYHFILPRCINVWYSSSWCVGMQLNRITVLWLRVFGCIVHEVCTYSDGQVCIFLWYD